MAVDYNQSELEKMQSEAVKRVREMQARAQRTVTPSFYRQDRTPSAGVNPLPKKEEPASKPPPPKAPAKKTGHASNSILNLINFKGLDLDGDTSLIALLILLLSSDKCDELLILALIYILL